MCNFLLSGIDRSLDTHDTIMDIVSYQEKSRPASRRLLNDKNVSTTMQTTPLPVRRHSWTTSPPVDRGSGW